MIYADYAATTPTDSRVAQIMEPYTGELFFNPSSLYPQARQVRGAVEKARAQIAGAVGAEPDQLIFTSGGTESDNLALLGTALRPEETRRHMITTAIEHHAVLESAAWLERQGFTVTYLQVDRHGLVNPEDLSRAMTGDTLLVSVMWVNNELGTVQDIQRLAEIAHSAGALFHSDAVQAMTTQAVDVNRAGVDLLSISSHKFYGPKGCGALYVRPGTQLIPMHPGGQQEGYRRGGTENTAGIVGMGAAAELLSQEREGHLTDLRRWKRRLIQALSGLDGVLLNSPEDKSAPSILNAAFSGVEAEGLVFHLSRAGVLCSMGAACNTQSVEPSHVVRAIGLPEEYRRGCLRLSLGRGLTDGAVEELGDIVAKTVLRLRGA